MASETIVLYKSVYGSTQRYAKVIAQALNADITELSEFTGSLNDYENIIFGGGLYAGSISGSKKFKKLLSGVKGKRIAVFMVGLNIPDEEYINGIAERGFTPEERRDISFFMFRGDYSLKDLGFIHRTMLSTLVKTLSKKDESELDDNSRGLIAMYNDGSAAYFDEKQTDALTAMFR